MSVPTPSRGRLATVAAGLVLLLVAGGCDVKTDVVLRPEVEGGASESRIAALEAQLGEQRQRADALVADVERMREESIVLSTDDGFTFRLNTGAAIVLIFAILGLVTVLVARMKFAAEARRRGSPDDLTEA